MYRCIAIACLALISMCVQAQPLKGIRIDTDDKKAVVYINRQQVSAPASSCFIANLRPGNYLVEVYRAKGSHHGDYRKSSRLMFRENVFYRGNGILDIDLDDDDDDDRHHHDCRPPYPDYGHPHRPDYDYPHHGSHGHHCIMPSDVFDDFYRAWKKADFDSDREDMLASALITTLFTSAQCRKILDICDFDSERVKLMKRIYPNISDKQNFFLVIEVLDFSSSKNEINNFIKSYHKKH